jgi:hypothetical protein
MKSDVLEQLKRARKYYHRDFRIQDKISSVLLHLEKDLQKFFSWMNSLSSDDHRYSLGGMVWILLPTFSPCLVLTC